MKQILINDILIPAIKRLYQYDYDNIRFGVSERNICARLAHHIENLMREYDQLQSTQLFVDYFADVEYNRMGNGDLKMYENSKSRPQYMVSDLLIQTRGYNPNLLAVEMKRKGNHKKEDDDRDRLMSIVSPPNAEMRDRCVHDTLLGAFIVYSVADVSIELYECVNERGQKTRSIPLPLFYLRE